MRLPQGSSDEPDKHLCLHVFATEQPSPMLAPLTGRLCRNPVLLPANGPAYLHEKKHGRLHVISGFWQQTHSFSHSGNCRVNSRREQLDMWMGGGGCSPKVCLASAVCDWLDWLSYLGLGRFKIPRSDCLARCSEPCWYKSALLRVNAATLKCPLSPFTDTATATQPCLLPGWDCVLLAAVCLAFPKRPCKVFWRRWEQGWRWGRSSFLGFSWFGIRSKPSPPPRSPARPYALAAAFMTLCKETFKMWTAANSNLFSGKRPLPTRSALIARRLWFSVVPKEWGGR